MEETNVDGELQLLQGHFGILAGVLAIQEVATVSLFAHPQPFLVANWQQGRFPIHGISRHE